MSSPCLTGGGRTYSLDIDIVKSPSISTRTSHTSSPASSTLSESSSSPLTISTRKPRTPRKRLNQTYNEAAALLSTAYPNIFSTNCLTNARSFFKPQDPFLFDDSSELLWPFQSFDNSSILLHKPIREKTNFENESKVMNLSSRGKSCQDSRGVMNFHGNSTELCDGYVEDFETESILDEEIEEGIDSIMGKLSVSNEIVDTANVTNWYENKMGLNLGGNCQLGFGIEGRRGVRALRQVDDPHWWNFSMVDLRQISPRLENKDCDSKPGDMKPRPKLKASEKKKKKKVEKPKADIELKKLGLEKGNPSAKLRLKLNYEEVLNAWSDRGSPFSDESLGSEGNDDVSVCVSSYVGK